MDDGLYVSSNVEARHLLDKRSDCAVGRTSVLSLSGLCMALGRIGY